MKLLHIDSSVLGDNSVTRELGAAIVAEWRCAAPALDVSYRDLAAQPLSHLSGAAFAARMTPAEQHTFEQRRDAAADNPVLDEFLAADVIVVGAPMYNFGIPCQLKAWIDRIAVAGKTFSYSEKGPVGLAGGKRLIVVSGRGGFYTPGTDRAAGDFQETYLRYLFGFLGITDIEFVRAEGVNISPEQRTRALQSAHMQVRGMFRLAA